MRGVNSYSPFVPLWLNCSFTTHGINFNCNRIIISLSTYSEPWLNKVSGKDGERGM
jgi:hypothetical protein